MLVARDRISSQIPPRNADVTPMMTARAVAIAPTSNARIIDIRIPTSNWDSTSWPEFVVPIRWAPDGARDTTAGFWTDGLYGVTSAPMIAARIKIPSTITPTFAVAGSRRQVLASDAATPPRTGLAADSVGSVTG